MHACDSVCQTHELIYVIGHVSTRSHLWKFPTWRSVCRGLSVVEDFLGEWEILLQSLSFIHNTDTKLINISHLEGGKLGIHSIILAWKIPRTEEPGGLQAHAVAKSQPRLRDWAQHRLVFKPPKWNESGGVSGICPSGPWEWAASSWPSPTHTSMTNLICQRRYSNSRWHGSEVEESLTDVVGQTSYHFLMCLWLRQDVCNL